MKSPPSPAAPVDEAEREPLLDAAPVGADCATGASETIHGTVHSSRENTSHRDQRYLGIAAATYSFLVLGLFVSTIGVILPHLQEYYHLTDIQVSAIFWIGPVGYVLACRLNDPIHKRFGQRGVAVIGPTCHLLCAFILSLRPSFPVFLAVAAVGWFGIGLLDGSWCAWVAALDKANTLSGLLHGSFSTGAAICPYLAGTMLSANHGLWHQWFYLLTGASALELVVLLGAFRHESAARYRDSKRERSHATSRNPAQRPAMFRYAATWVYAAYLLACVGTECTISDWVVSFMHRVRHASTYASSICSSGFWAGMALGRLALGFVTDGLGVKRAVVLYLLLALAFTVLFILVRVLWVAALSMSLVGFVMGPLFPSCIVQLVSILPNELHVAVVSFVASVGQVGGALLPYILGAMTDAVGLQAFQYMLLVQFAVLLVIWVGSFRLSAKNDSERVPQRFVP